MAITRILFVCHGNICRSPMAEFILKDMVSKAFISDAFEIDSAAVSREEIYRDHASNKDIGNPVYPPAKRMLMEHGIGVPGNELGVSRKRARQITEADYDRYDMIVCMDEMNVRNVRRITGADPENKLSLMLDHTSEKGGEVADPWYTGDFTASWDDISRGCRGILEECMISPAELKHCLESSISSREWESLENNDPDVYISAFNRSVILGMRSDDIGDGPASIGDGPATAASDIYKLSVYLKDYLDEYLSDRPEAHKWIIMVCLYNTFVKRVPMHPQDAAHWRTVGGIHYCPSKNDSVICRYCCCLKDSGAPADDA